MSTAAAAVFLRSFVRACACDNCVNNGYTGAADGEVHLNCGGSVCVDTRSMRRFTGRGRFDWILILRFRQFQLDYLGSIRSERERVVFDYFCEVGWHSFYTVFFAGIAGMQEEIVLPFFFSLE